MKANELMIDDWVLWKGKPVQVASVSGVKYSFGQIDITLAHCNDEKLLETHDIKSIQPIPLTQEILEKNGFEKCVVTNGMEIDKKFNPYHITKQLYIHDGMCGTIVCCSDGGSKLSPLFECKYVHQLQHILKASGILNEIVL